MNKIQVNSFEQWASIVYENQSSVAFSSYFFDKGESSIKSLFECIVSSVDESLNESLDANGFDFEEVDTRIMEGIALSINENDEERLDEVFGFIKNAVDSAMSTADKVINKGIELGTNLYTSVKEFSGKIKEAVKAVYEKVKKFLSLMWEDAKKRGANTLSKVKDVFKKSGNAKHVETIADMLSDDAVEKELQAASSDIKTSISKINGTAYKVDPSKVEAELKTSAEKLEDASGDEIEELVLGEVDKIGESQVYQLVTSIKGALLEGYTIENVLSTLDDTMNEEDGHGHKKKSLLGWLMEAIGFLLAPFGKLYEKAIKTGSNSVLRTVSAIARGGFDKAYKYSVLGILASLVYHVIHGVTEIGAHLSHSAHGTHESVINEEKELFFEKAKRMFTWENTEKVLTVGLGVIFCKALKAFFPMVGLILEIIITAVATIELIAAICELGDMESKSFCSIILKTEHKFL